MKEILYNPDNLSSKDIDEVIIRTKGLIINSNDEITLGYAHKTYQFPGGHLEEGEKLEDCLLREIKEETGIEIKDAVIEPFIKTTYYTKNYHGSGQNRISNVLYYYLKTNCKPDSSNVNLTEEEIKKQFFCDYISMEQFEEYVKSFLNNEKEINRTIAKEILVVFDELKNILK